MSMGSTPLSGKRRAVITGIGVISPCGQSQATLWDNLVNGRSGIDLVHHIDVGEQPCKVAGEVKDFEPETYMDKKEARRMDRFQQFAMAASVQAYEDAGLSEAKLNPERFSVVIGSASGGISTVENNTVEVRAHGIRKCSPFFVPMMISDIAGGRVSIRFNAQGPNFAVITACATGADSIGNAFRMIQYGETDIALTGGSEASITPISMAGFAAARALSTNNDDPQGASRPFDLARDGFIMGEGSCVIVLEELEHAQRRGAKIYGELVGYGRSSDGYDIVMPQPEGLGATRAMKYSIEEAGIQPEEIGYLNAHATSTPLGDIAETHAIHGVFHEHSKSRKLLVSSTKSMTGHMLGAAGAIEGVICLMALQHQLIPPTINVVNQDPECDLDVVPNQARPVSGMRYALSNSFGFGGHNASLVFKRWE